MAIKPEQAIKARQRQERQQQLRRDQITEESMQTLLQGIEQIEQDDPKMAAALREIGHILTGDNRFEVQETTVNSKDLSTDYVSAEIAASVADGNSGTVWVTTIADGETLNVTQAGLVNNDGSAVPSGCDLIIADLTNSVSETTLITGDGTVKDDETGSPLGSYQNNSGGDEQVAVMVDNGKFNGGSGGEQIIIGSFIGRVV